MGPVDKATACTLAVRHNPALRQDPAQAAVREEHGFVPDAEFREGRAAVLRHLLALPRLFRTPPGRDRWELTARRNLATELELLTA